MGDKLDFNLDFLDKKDTKSVVVEKEKNESSEELVKVNEENEKSEKVSKYASFKIRLGAYAIDVMGVIVASVIVYLALAAFLGQSVYNWSELIMGYLGYVLYNTFTLTIWSTTLGKKLYGLKVMTQGERLNFKFAFKRSLLQPFSTFIFGIGYWDMNNNQYKQAWHDKRANTVVVRKKKGLALAYIFTVIGSIVWIWLYTLGSATK